MIKGKIDDLILFHACNAFNNSSLTISDVIWQKVETDEAEKIIGSFLSNISQSSHTNRRRTLIMRLLWAKSIKQKFIYWFAIIITMAILVFSAVLIIYNASSTEKNLHSQANHILSFSTQSLASAMWQYNQAYVNDYIDSLFLYKDMVFVRAAIETQIVKTKTSDRYKNLTFSDSLDSAKFIVRESDIVYNNENVGKLTFVMSKERIGQQVFYSSLATGLLLLFIISIISLTMYILFRKYVLNPLFKLDNSARLIASGDLDAPIDTTSEDELGQLARSFSQMMQKIKSVTASRDELNYEIAERKQTEQALRESEEKLARSNKMEAMGLMAGGIAHDLNNILSGIVSYPELLLLDLPEDSPLRKPIKTIQESGMRAADVVEDLLTIARGVATGKEVLNINTTTEEYLDSAEHQKLEKTYPSINFKTELDFELLNITSSATHIKKILMNLVINASEAIEGKGTVTVSTITRYLDEPLKGYEDVHIGEYVVLAVSDDGSGISPQDLDKIFEPFYTKKVMGRSGTGLGLAVVWNSMQDHDGYINVKSSKKGTVFELYFPVTRQEVAAEKEEVPLEDYRGHGEKILVVDDEERQREIAGGILTRLGYTAETVSSGKEAIEFVKENPVDLIVLDMVMPKGINGRKTYEEIIKIRPGQKAIIASGYAKTKEVDKAQELGAGKYIKKPYTLAKVGLAVKEELEK